MTLAQRIVEAVSVKLEASKYSSEPPHEYVGIPSDRAFCRDLALAVVRMQEQIADEELQKACNANADAIIRAALAGYRQRFSALRRELEQEPKP